MEFGVIWTIDAHNESEVKPLDAFAEEMGMDRTEGDDCLQHGHYFRDVCGPDETPRHRKFVGVLDAEELQRLSDQTGCYPMSPQERGPVMGVPGSGLLSSGEGLFFHGSGRQGPMQELCVTPYPEMETVDPWPLDEQETDRLFKAVYNHFA